MINISNSGSLFRVFFLSFFSLFSLLFSSHFFFNRSKNLKKRSVALFFGFFPGLSAYRLISWCQLSECKEAASREQLTSSNGNKNNDLALYSCKHAFGQLGLNGPLSTGQLETTAASKAASLHLFGQLASTGSLRPRSGRLLWASNRHQLIRN